MAKKIPLPEAQSKKSRKKLKSNKVLKKPAPSTDLVALFDGTVSGKFMLRDFDQIFNQIEIAEGVIVDFGGRGSTADQLLKYQPRLPNMPVKAYEAHCKEIAQRLIDGKRIDVATDGELLTALSEMSLKQKLNRNAMLLQHRLVMRHFPDFDLGLKVVPNDFEEEEVDKLEVELCKQLTRHVKALMQTNQYFHVKTEGKLI